MKFSSGYELFSLYVPTLTCGHCVKLNAMVYAGRSEMRKNYEVIRLIQDAFARVIPQFPICKKRHNYVTSVMLSMPRSKR